MYRSSKPWLETAIDNDFDSTAIWVNSSLVFYEVRLCEHYRLTMSIEQDRALLKSAAYYIYYIMVLAAVLEELAVVEESAARVVEELN